MTEEMLAVLLVRPMKPGLPDHPKGYTRETGSYAAISARAVKLNKVQIDQEYVFFPELAPTEPNRTHCGMCKRIAIRDAIADD